MSYVGSCTVGGPHSVHKTARNSGKKGERDRELVYSCENRESTKTHRSSFGFPQKHLVTAENQPSLLPAGKERSMVLTTARTRTQPLNCVEFWSVVQKLTNSNKRAGSRDFRFPP